MTKAELVARIAEKSSLTKANAEHVLNALLEAMKETLSSEGKVSLPGLGSLHVQDRKQRKGHNPRTGEAIIIPASKSITFKAGETLRKQVR